MSSPEQNYFFRFAMRYPVCEIETPKFWYGPPKILVKKEIPSCM